MKGYQSIVKLSLYLNKPKVEIDFDIAIPNPNIGNRHQQ